MTTAADSNDKLAAVRAKFIAGIKERAATIEGILLLPDGEDKRAQLQHITHKIAGSAGFYGEDKIAEIAAKLDTSLQTSKNVIDLRRLTDEINELLTMLHAL